LSDTFNDKIVKYAYQEWPHPADTASPHSKKVRDEKRAWFYNNQIQKDATNN
jgi:hypothetical protein